MNIYLTSTVKLNLAGIDLLMNSDHNWKSRSTWLSFYGFIGHHQSDQTAGTAAAIVFARGSQPSITALNCVCDRLLWHFAGWKVLDAEWHLHVIAGGHWLLHCCQVQPIVSHSLLIHLSTCETSYYITLHRITSKLQHWTCGLRTI